MVGYFISFTILKIDKTLLRFIKFLLNLYTLDLDDTCCINLSLSGRPWLLWLMLLKLHSFLVVLISHEFH